VKLSHPIIFVTVFVRTHREAMDPAIRLRSRGGLD